MTRPTTRASAWLVATLVAAGLVAVPSTGHAKAANPKVTAVGATGVRGYPLWDSWFDLKPFGYVEQEYFVSGTARNDAGATASYTTRIIVTRPASAKKFNGSVMLDWVNVTAQFENAVDIAEGHELLVREGWAFVHVSAQAAGICCTPLTPKVWDPVRYAALSHPGDAYANDMFSQIAQAVKYPRGTDPLGKLPRSRKVIAAGQSQSASKLDNYVRTTQSTARVIDGFLIHGGGSKEYDTAPTAPVLHLLSDREASPTKPTARRNYRLWEVAGSAHSDFWIGYHQEVGQGPRFLGAPKQPASAEAELHKVAGNYGEAPHPMHATCIFAGASFPTRYAVNAALHHLNRWVRRGVMPPVAPRYKFNGDMLARDGKGNALGGLRLPPVDVPVATYASSTCQLGGITVPFTDVELHQLYPTHAAYYAKMKQRTAAAVKAGFLLPPDAADLLARAKAAAVRW